jgi:hypothetical protein
VNVHSVIDNLGQVSCGNKELREVDRAESSLGYLSLPKLS